MRDKNHKEIKRNNDNLRHENFKLRLKDEDNSSIITTKEEANKDLTSKIKSIVKERNLHKTTVDAQEKAGNKEVERKERVVERLLEDKKTLKSIVSSLKSDMSTLNKINSKKEQENTKLRSKKNAARKEVRKTKKKESCFILFSILHQEVIYLLFAFATATAGIEFTTNY